MNKDNYFVLDFLFKQIIKANSITMKLIHVLGKFSARAEH